MSALCWHSCNNNFFDSAGSSYSHMMEHVWFHTWQKIMDQECCTTTTDIFVFPHVFPSAIKPGTGDKQNHSFRWLIICRCSAATGRWLYTVGLINSTPPDYYWFLFQKVVVVFLTTEWWWLMGFSKRFLKTQKTFPSVKAQHWASDCTLLSSYKPATKT